MQIDLSQLQAAFSWAELLGRGERDCDAVRMASVAGRRVLVTGAGGFIGAEMVRRLAASGAERVILLESAEQALFAIDAEMGTRGDGERCVPVLGSVCDEALLAALFDEHRPELVMHAGALKHVPLMERNPLAALETNALGTWRLARVCEAFGAQQMILVSTDKAVAPKSIMGASKRIAELAILAHPELGAAVRLVNVIGSPFSVGPIFAEQIARGGPVTVTHPEARRYFLTLGEVAELLAEAMDGGTRGILVPAPGEPVLIRELAQRMVARCNTQTAIAYTAPRPGDKLDETLIGARERLAGEATRGLRRVASPAAEDLEAEMRALEAAVAARDLTGALEVVMALAPDYEPSVAIDEALREAAVASR